MGISTTPVQKVQASGAAVNSVDLVFGSDNTAGNALIIDGSTWSAGSLPVGDWSDSQSNTYRTGVASGENTGSETSAVHFCEDCAAGANTITFDPTPTGFYGWFEASEWSGVGTETTPDTTLSGTGTNDSPTATSGATDTGEVLVYANCAVSSSSTDVEMDLPSGFTAVDTFQQNSNAIMGWGSAFKIKTGSSAAETAGFGTLDTAPSGWTVTGIVLKAAPAGGATGVSAIGAPGQQGSGAQEVAATGVSAIGAPGQQGSGAQEVAATGVSAIGAPGQQGSGAEVFAGAGVSAIAAPGQQGAGAEVFAGSGVSALAAPQQAASGAQAIAATGVQALAAPGQAGVGLAIGAGGIGSSALSAPQQAALGLLEIFAVGIQALAAPQQNGLAAVPADGVGISALAAPRQNGLAAIDGVLGGDTPQDKRMLVSLSHLMVP